MYTLWFWLVAGMLVFYTILDGFDLGAGTLHLLLARNNDERRLVLRSIGPVWDGNEVWLLAAGGTLYFAFPGLYASSFSGFYLPLMMVLWLLVLRGISIEFRGHLHNEVWAPFWDAVFWFASALLALFLGVALGNVIRGVPLNAEGWFFEPLWTNWGVRGETGILDWYTVVVGLAGLASLTMHGAFWVWGKTDGDLAARARRYARNLWPVVLLLAIVVTVLTFIVQPIVPQHLKDAPWGLVFAFLALAGLVTARIAIGRDDARTGFFGSAAYLAGMLASAAFGIYPYVLPATTDPAYGLTAQNVGAPLTGLYIGLVWWVPGMIIAAAYITYVYRRFAGKVSLEGEGY